jgi:hypothetical protein
MFFDIFFFGEKEEYQMKIIRFCSPLTKAAAMKRALEMR